MEEFTDISEEDAVFRFQRGDKRAGELILVKYKNAVLAMARRFFLYGGDTEDLVQEGMCGLYSAMMSFEGGVFSAYAHACIRNRILDAVKKSESSKNYALNGCSFINNDGELPAEDYSPEERLISSETAEELTNIMQRVLSSFEYKALRMYIDGATMAEIAKTTGKTYKQTDNALTRAKKKLRRVIAK